VVDAAGGNLALGRRLVDRLQQHRRPFSAEVPLAKTSAGRYLLHLILAKDLDQPLARDRQVPAAADPAPRLLPEACLPASRRRTLRPLRVE
jgi:hypothetical protein